jgi:hypothetical protein
MVNILAMKRNVWLILFEKIKIFWAKNLIEVRVGFVKNSGQLTLRITVNLQVVYSNDLKHLN